MNGTIFEKIVIEHKMCVLNFHVSNISDSTVRISETDRQTDIAKAVVMYSTVVYSCHILTQLQFCRYIFQKVPTPRLNKNPSSVSIRIEGQTDGQAYMTQLTVAVRNLARAPKGPPHTYSFTFSFNCTVRSRVCWKFHRFVQLKFLDCVTLGTAENLTAQFTLDCSVCCVLKAEAQFVYISNAVNTT